jgi:hypothetical protein
MVQVISPLRLAPCSSASRLLLQSFGPQVVRPLREGEGVLAAGGNGISTQPVFAPLRTSRRGNVDVADGDVQLVDHCQRGLGHVGEGPGEAIRPEGDAVLDVQGVAVAVIGPQVVGARGYREGVALPRRYAGVQSQPVFTPLFLVNGGDVDVADFVTGIVDQQKGVPLDGGEGPGEVLGEVNFPLGVQEVSVAVFGAEVVDTGGHLEDPVRSGGDHLVLPQPIIAP